MPAPILIVDDHPRNLDALEAILAPLGEPITRAESGDEALKRLLFEEFAVILLDVEMRDLDGFKTAELFRRRERTRRVPLLFVTALDVDDATILRGYALGAADFIRKPFDPDILVSKVSVFVNLHRQREEIDRQAELLTERERFIGVLGHDLRSPLSAILLTAEQLRSQSELTEGSKKGIERIGRSATRMVKMVENVVQFVRTMQRDFPVVTREFDLLVLCRQLADEIEAANPGRSIVFDAPGGSVGEWDFDLLGQVVQNLLSNAVAYSPSDSPVTLTIRDGTEVVSISVHNVGEPIPAESLATIFDPYRRALSMATSRRHQGLGLGLYIARAIVEAHGGTIAVESDASRGTRFDVTLPRRKRPTTGRLKLPSTAVTRSLPPGPRSPRA